MGRTSAAFHRNWCVWVVLFFSGGIKALVNSIEQPFARSLISCGVPVSSQAYSGSDWCGDRLQVIQEGVQLSAYGQSQENLSMLMVLGFVIIATGMWGPKLPLKLGLCGVIGSVVLFMVACGTPLWARTLFMAGQFLQGIFPIEYLSGILMFFVAIQPGADTEANMQLTTYSGLISGIVWNSGLGDTVQLLQVNNYFWIWAVVLVLNTSIFLMVQFGFPEMDPLDAKPADKHQPPPVRRLLLEAVSYTSLFSDWMARRLLLKAFCEGLVHPFGRVTGGMLMAYHGWTQRGLTLCFLFPQLISIKSMPVYDKVKVRLGEYRTYVLALRISLLSWVVTALTLPYTDQWHVLVTYTLPLLIGFYAKRGYLESRFIPHAQMVRLQNVQWLMNYFLGTWVGPVYSAAFDAYAWDYRTRAVPGLLCCGATFLTYLSYFYGLYNLDGVYGFAVSLRTLDQGYESAVKLWNLAAYGPGPDLGVISKERSDMYRLEEILGLQLEVWGGTIWNLEHWLTVIGSMNGTNTEGLQTVRNMEIAASHAASLWPLEDRQKQRHTLWNFVAGSSGELHEEAYVRFRLEELFGEAWPSLPMSREEFHAMLDALPPDVQDKRVARCVQQAQDWHVKHAMEEQAAWRAAPKPAPARQHFLARSAQVVALLMFFEAVLVARGPGNDIFHALMALAVWRTARQPFHMAGWKAVLCCFATLWLGGVAWATGWDVRHDLLNLVWLVFIMSAPIAVLRYFFELDMEGR